MIKIFILFSAWSSIVIAGVPPNWYYSIHPTSTSQIIGYGEADSLSKAKSQARDDIAKRIKTSINSTATQSTNLSGDTLKQDYNEVIEEKTIATLQDIKLLEKFQNEDGKYYVAMSYDNIPFITRFTQKLDINRCKEKQNNYLKHTFFISQIDKITKCTPDIRLIRNDKTWYLVYKNTKEELPTKYFEQLYKSVENKNIHLRASKNLLKDGDEFSLSLKSKKNGYISLLDVYEDGTVSVLVANIKVKKNKLVNIPDKDYDSSFVAGLIEQNKPTFDLYVAIYSKSRVDLSRFQQANRDLTTGESNKKFDELIYKLNQYQFATILLRTLP